MNPFTPHLMSLFDGNREAHGIFKFSGEMRADGKVKGQGVTIRTRILPTLWDEHLDGTHQLGIIPINGDSLTKFGAIDIDSYNLDRNAIHAKIFKDKIPVVPFRSKSGGVHLYLFTSDFVPASMMQFKLRAIAAYLGFGTAEIYPKQSKILKDRGDIGQWINMPYFNLKKTERFAYDPETNKPLLLKEFLDYVSPRILNPQELEKYSLPIDETIPQGPPCLQHLSTQGFPDGTRNQGLFALGVYAQKVEPDAWQKMVEDFNVKLMKPPLSPKEVLTIIASLTKKEYNYPCKKSPICEHCNISLCRTRKYGIGEAMGMPSMGTLTKLKTEPPIWFIEIEGGGRLELSTDDLQNPMKFQKRCLDTLNIMPTLPKRQDWQIIVANLLENLTEVPVALEATPAGQMMQYLEDFCVNRAGNAEEGNQSLLRGLIWNNVNRHHFRLADFVQYLDRKKFYEFRLHQIASILRSNKCTHETLRVNGKNLSIYSIAQFNMDVEKYITPIQKNKDVPF